MTEAAKVEKPKKEHIAIRLIAFMALYGLVRTLGFYAAIGIAVLAGVAWLVIKARGLTLPSPYAIRGLRYVTLASSIAAAGLTHDLNLDVQRATAESQAIVDLKLAKELVDAKHFGDAKSKLSKIADGTTVQRFEAKEILESVQVLTSADALKTKILALSKEQFNDLLAGKTVPLLKDQSQNEKANAIAREVAPKYKTEFNAAIKLKEKAEKEALAEAKAEEKRKADHAKLVAKFGEPPEASAWDGSYTIAERYLKEHANDPDSIKMNGCTKVSIDRAKGWIFGCEFRGKNKFGGLVKNANWFVIKNKQIISVLPGDAYNAH